MLKIAIIGCLVMSGVSIALIILSAIEHKRAAMQIDALIRDNEKLRRHNRYQQKEIESLREHNGNLYDENAVLKNNIGILNNIPDFGKKW